VVVAAREDLLQGIFEIYAIFADNFYWFSKNIHNS
jgi:hypothetical protein